jgi:hypothetical protein
MPKARGWVKPRYQYTTTAGDAQGQGVGHLAQTGHVEELHAAVVDDVPVHELPARPILNLQSRQTQGYGYLRDQPNASSPRATIVSGFTET